MSIPGLFVEYLVIGVVATVWMLPWILTYSPKLPQGDISSLMFLPGFYVVGMIIDYIGWRILRSLRNRIKRDTYQKYKGNESESEGFMARLLLHAPDLARTLEMYSSRDRIARGTLINSLISAISYVLYFWIYGQITSVLVSVFICTLAIILTLLLWMNYQRNSYRFEVHSLHAFKEMLEDKHKTHLPDSAQESGNQSAVVINKSKRQ